MIGYGFAIGLGSTLMGVSDGSLATMALTLHGKPIHQAVATSAGIGVPISLAGMLGYIARFATPGVVAAAVDRLRLADRVCCDPADLELGRAAWRTARACVVEALARNRLRPVSAPCRGALSSQLCLGRTRLRVTGDVTRPRCPSSILRHGPSPQPCATPWTAIGNKTGGLLKLTHRYNFGRVAKPPAGLRPRSFAFPGKLDVKHRLTLLRIGTDHRAGRQRWTLP